MSENPKTLEAKIAAYREELLEPASTLLAVQRVCGDQVKEKTMAAYSRLVEAHLLLIGVLGKALLRVNEKIVETTAKSEERTALLASFVIGIDLCERAIAEGRYLQALGLLRQEMETIAQLTAVELGTRKDGQTPNIAVLEESIRRLYGDLSAATHLAQHHIVRSATEFDVSGLDVPGPTSGTRFFPEFDEGIARRSFGLHLLLIARLVEQMSLDHEERHAEADRSTERDVEAVNLALSLMQSEGVIEIG